ncbi:MAG: alpha/beta fold hydrolase [Desulfobacterales bacterium]|nr:MAG: alpha/beta fold hydrolase [Desulfobacterales bacterium]
MRNPGQAKSGSDVLQRLAGRCGVTTGVDVVFVHGAEEDAEGCWYPRGHPEFSLPRMLARELPYVCAWSLHYEYSIYRRKAHTLPLAEQATSSIRELVMQKIGRKPVVFVAHSVGGILVKHVLRLAQRSPDPAWRNVLHATVGVVFLATPHFGFPLTPRIKTLSRWLPTLRKVLLAELDDLSELDDLNRSFGRMVAERAIEVDVYYEGRRTRRTLWWGFLVSKASADPQIPTVIPTVVNANHDKICKPTSENAHIYRSVREFVRRCFADPCTDVFVSYAHEDIAALEQMMGKLEPLVRSGAPGVWYDKGQGNRGIEAGQAWETEIQKHLEGARVAVLLISPAFLNSQYITTAELPFLCRKADTEGLILLCVPVGPVDLEKLSCRYDLPQGGYKEFRLTDAHWTSPPQKSLAAMSQEERDRFFTHLAHDIFEATEPPVSESAKADLR